MIRLWLTLRRLRQRATPRSDERGAMEAYLRKNGAFSSERMVWSYGRSFAIALVVVLIVSVSVSSYAYASDAVLPDTVLYPVRQALEVVETKLAVTPAQKEKVQEKIVERRVKEVKKLEELKRPVPVKLKKLVEERVTTTTRAVRTIKRQEQIRAGNKEEKNEKKEVKKQEQQIRKQERIQEKKRELKRQEERGSGKLRSPKESQEKTRFERLKERLNEHRKNRKR